MFFGLALVLVGLIFLLQNLGLISGNYWSILWPCLVMLIGINIIFKREPKSRWKKIRERIGKSFKEENK
jgi:hypothetical protein